GARGVRDSIRAQARSVILSCALPRHALYLAVPATIAAGGGAGGEAERRRIGPRERPRVGRVPLAAALPLPAAAPAAAQNHVRFPLDGRLEGLAAPFLLPQDKGYFRSEGLDVTVDEAATVLEPITRVASGGYEMALADINTLIKYRDQHPAAPIKAIFIVYNKPPFAIVGRKSRGSTEPKQLE